MTKPTKPKTSPAPVVPPPTFEDGLIVGLLMARGSFTGDKNMPRIFVRGDLDLLQWVKSRIGGTISGPYEQPNRNPVYAFQVSGPSLAPVVELIGTHMPASTQRKKYAAWVEKHRSALTKLSAKPA